MAGALEDAFVDAFDDLLMDVLVVDVLVVDGLVAVPVVVLVDAAGHALEDVFDDSLDDVSVDVLVPCVVHVKDVHVVVNVLDWEAVAAVTDETVDVDVVVVFEDVADEVAVEDALGHSQHGLVADVDADALECSGDLEDSQDLLVDLPAVMDVLENVVVAVEVAVVVAVGVNADSAMDALDVEDVSVDCVQLIHGLRVDVH